MNLHTSERRRRAGRAAGHGARVIGAAGLLLCASTAAHAQARDTLRVDTTVFRVGEIMVQAARPITTVGGASAVEVQIETMVLRPAPLLEEVLRNLPMLHVRTNSRGESEISVRGSESRQVAVLVDGVPLTLGWDARTDVSVVPATAPQQISFIRGLSSMLYGPNVLGGVVEVGVGRAAQMPERSLRFSGGFDHVGGFGSSATVTLPFDTDHGQWLVRAGAGHRTSPGATLAKGIVEPLPGEDDLRVNTDSDLTDGFVAASYRADGGAWVSFAGSGYRAERGIAAELGVNNARFWRYPDIRRTIAVLSAGTGDRSSPFGGRGDIEASFGVDRGRSDIDAYDTRAYGNVVSFENGESQTLTFRALADQTLGRRGELRSAFTFAEIRHDEFLPAGDNRYVQRLWSLGGELGWRLSETSSIVRASLGAALDGASTPESGNKPALEALTDWGARAGITAAFPGNRLALHAGLSRRGRFPSLRELYSVALNRFAPNPGLTGEHLTAFETGVTARIASGEAQAVVFHHRLNDAIQRVRLPDGRFQRVNRNQIRSTGLELLLTQTFDRVGVSGDLTLQSVDVIDPVAGVTNRPENLPELFGSLKAQAPIAAGFAISASANYTGRQWCIDPGSGADLRLDGGTRLDGALSRSWSIRSAGGFFDRLETRVSVDNIGNTAVFDQCGLSQPGRLLRFQIMVN